VTASPRTLAGLAKHRATAQRLLRAILDETIMDREDAQRMITEALCEAYDAGTHEMRVYVRDRLLRSAGLG
jgi:hypothetical protein